MWNDKKPTLVTYYHINAEMSTLDEASGMNYSDLGPNCPFRYNKIGKFVLYGIDRIALSHPGVRISLMNDGKALLNTSASSSNSRLMGEVYGVESG